MIEVADLVPEMNLQPGELYLARSPAMLRTILGSCVGVTFWSRRLGAGALCHGVLPRLGADRRIGIGRAEASRYVDFSIRYLVRAFEALGTDRKELVVKAFGGSDVLAFDPSPSGRPTVGAQNCLAALEVLEEQGLIVSATDLGGRRGRRIHFHTGTGEVLLHRLSEWKESH